MTATTKQISYAMSLLQKAGYRTDWMDASFKPLATMAERNGRVSDWLAGKSRSEMSALIDMLQKKAR